MILEKARELGIALSQSDEFLRLQSANEMLENNEPVSSLIQEYRQQQDTLLAILAGDQDIDVQTVTTLSNDIEAMKNQLLENPIFSEVLQAQQEFEQLVSQVHQEINSCIGITSPAVDHVSGSCSGNCASCKGCGH